MKINYCLPIIKAKKSEVLESIRQAPNYDYYEIWLDYIEDLDETFIEKIIKDHERKLILLFRRQNLEKIRMVESERTAVLDLLHKKKTYVDLDITVQKPELQYINDNNLEIPVIISYHNYLETPYQSELQTIIENIIKLSPAIVKIAAQCNNDSDALILMNILQMLRQRKQRYIILGMGEYGKITRILGLLWGNEINFAPQSTKEKSAPGQLTKKQFENILRNLFAV